ncbi:MAG: cytochrome C oxidase subunit IV family protein [Ardenticatenaceae bacterium]|nr:cytochrome C oxidase subunit IV family protein [Anaerolineales bacterium]MCB8918794.1 cytochrome C oxidase subunit IV family protein [Ardenticatenaceae bacterium]
MEKSAAYRQVFIVFVILAVLTGVEFAIALYYPSTALLFIVALAKAGLIVNYFMHIYRLWRQEGH